METNKTALEIITELNKDFVQLDTLMQAEPRNEDAISDLRKDMSVRIAALEMLKRPRTETSPTP